MSEAASMSADRAERLLETLRQCEPGEADLQASAMVMAGLCLLQEVRGTPSVLDSLARLGSMLAGTGPAAAAEGVPPLETPEASPLSDPVERALGYLRALPLEVARAEAEVATIAAGTFLREAGPAPITAAEPHEVGAALRLQLHALPRDEAAKLARSVLSGVSIFLGSAFGEGAALGALAGAAEAMKKHQRAASAGRPLEAPRATPLDPPKSPAQAGMDAAFATLLRLRSTRPEVAHDEAVAAVAGSATYLHELHGFSTASGLLRAVMENAAENGSAWRGGRDSSDTLH